MPTEELRKALQAAKVTDVEADFVDVLCRAFDAQRPLVLRILYAAQYCANHVAGTSVTWTATEELDPKLREAIRSYVDAGRRRVALADKVRSNGHALAYVDALVPEGAPHKICDGCPKSLECVAESLFDPKDCRDGRGAWTRSLETRPIKMRKNKVTVECDHPRGTFVLDIKDFDL